MKILGFEEEYLDSVQCFITLENAPNLVVCEGAIISWKRRKLGDTLDVSVAIRKLRGYNVPGWIYEVFTSEVSYLYGEKGCDLSLDSEDRILELNDERMMNGWLWGDAKTSTFRKSDWKFLERCAKAIIIKACERRDKHR